MQLSSFHLSPLPGLLPPSHPPIPQLAELERYREQRRWEREKEQLVHRLDANAMDTTLGGYYKAKHAGNQVGALITWAS